MDMFSFIEGDDLYTEQRVRTKEASREITRAVYAFHRMTENALQKVSSTEDIDDLLKLAKYELEDCVSQYMPTVSDPQAKLRRAIIQEGLQLVASKKVAGALDDDDPEAQEMLAKFKKRLPKYLKRYKIKLTEEELEALTQEWKAELFYGMDSEDWNDELSIAADIVLGEKVFKDVDQSNEEEVKKAIDSLVSLGYNDMTERDARDILGYYNKYQEKKKKRKEEAPKEEAPKEEAPKEETIDWEQTFGDEGAEPEEGDNWQAQFGGTPNEDGDMLDEEGNYNGLTLDITFENGKYVASIFETDYGDPKEVGKYDSLEEAKKAIQEAPKEDRSDLDDYSESQEEVAAYIEQLEGELGHSFDDLSEEDQQKAMDAFGEDSSVDPAEVAKLLNSGYNDDENNGEDEEFVDDTITERGPNDGQGGIGKYTQRDIDTGYQEFESRLIDEMQDAMLDPLSVDWKALRKDFYSGDSHNVPEDGDEDEISQLVEDYRDDMESNGAYGATETPEDFDGDSEAIWEWDGEKFNRKEDSTEEDEEAIDEEDTPEADFEKALEADPDSSDEDGDGNPDTGKTYKGKDKNGNDVEGTLVKMIFGKPKVRTESGEEVMLHDWEKS